MLGKRGVARGNGLIEMACRVVAEPRRFSATRCVMGKMKHGATGLGGENDVG